jgi:hypothetical protein
MKNLVTKAVVLSLVLGPIALAGCQKKCGHHEEVNHKVEKMKRHHGGK